MKFSDVEPGVVGQLLDLPEDVGLLLALGDDDLELLELGGHDDELGLDLVELLFLLLQVLDLLLDLDPFGPQGLELGVLGLEVEEEGQGEDEDGEDEDPYQGQFFMSFTPFLAAGFAAGSGAAGAGPAPASSRPWRCSENSRYWSLWTVLWVEETRLTFMNTGRCSRGWRCNPR